MYKYVLKQKYKVYCEGLYVRRRKRRAGGIQPAQNGGKAGRDKGIKKRPRALGSRPLKARPIKKFKDY